MQIYVNDQILEATQSGEKSLWDVYESVNEWTTKNEKFILGFLVDHAEYTVNQLKDIKPEGIGRFDFFIGDEVEMMISTIDELDRYIDQIGTALYEEEVKTENDFINLSEGMHWISEIMNSVSNILKINLDTMLSPVNEAGELPVNDILKRLQELSDDLKNNYSSAACENLLASLRGLKSFVMKLSFQVRMMNASFDELMESIEDFENKIDELTENMVAVNVAFNTGKDGEALNYLDSLSEKLNHYLSAIYALDYKYSADEGTSLFKATPSGEALLNHASMITDQLRNLSDALEKRDIVTAGDILEYEMTESLKNLQPHLAGIKEFLLARK